VKLLGGSCTGSASILDNNEFADSLGGGGGGNSEAGGLGGTYGGGGGHDG
jgi:hypothetical protein